MKKTLNAAGIQMKAKNLLHQLGSLLLLVAFTIFLGLIYTAWYYWTPDWYSKWMARIIYLWPF